MYSYLILLLDKIRTLIIVQLIVTINTLKYVIIKYYTLLFIYEKEYWILLPKTLVSPKEQKYDFEVNFEKINYSSKLL